MAQIPALLKRHGESHLDQNTLLTPSARYIGALVVIISTPSFHFHSVSLLSSLSASVSSDNTVLLLSPCEGGQLLADGRIRASDSLAGVHSRQSSGDPQHLFLFHQLCRGSVGHIWPRLSLIASKCLLFLFQPSGDQQRFALSANHEGVSVHDSSTLTSLQLTVLFIYWLFCIRIWNLINI